jgi:hypothetical protein
VHRWSRISGLAADTRLSANICRQLECAKRNAVILLIQIIKAVLVSECPSNVPGVLLSALKLTINLELLILGLKSACGAAKDRAYVGSLLHKRE